ncbi:MAG TPA: glycosyl hydrolase family 65 protein [Smithellaceae bacterium]|nr:glycosyl hydrolase family 65 protein [Smithellaceae bacterium]HRS88619.1 glycosyl hydrolase family 65 protein [Smithellaceae bacterium]HRV25899.1 glycosyl hydrolase family 65 protein [Smithellaceae bacterium]
MNDWLLAYDNFDPATESLREALCALGNGYFVARGAACETQADNIHYPGTYLAGGYNRLKTEISGHIVENEDLVNMPNGFLLKFKIEDGDWFKISETEILAYRQELDIRRGMLTRFVRFRDRQKRETTVTCRRIVSMKDMHIAAQEIVIVPENWSGRLYIHSALDGTVINNGVARYRKLASKHLAPLETGTCGEDGLYLVCETNQSHIRVALSERTNIFLNNKIQTPRRQICEKPGYIAQEMEINVQKTMPVRIEKIFALYTSRDPAISEPSLDAREALKNTNTFGDLLESHILAWRHLWNRFDITVADGPRTQMIIRLHIFHLLQTVSMHSVNLDIGVPARGWHGEAYRGHIFWDEIFIFPLLTIRAPEITRALLLYRYRRLNQARLAAKEEGYKGAMYPWQSSSNGREETQQLHLNPKSGRWLPDNTHLQRHANTAIAYNIWQYFETTHDLAFLSKYGAEMLLEIARFLASLTSYNQQRQRFEIRGVMGPDEYHDKYPGAEEPGLNNNSYTNVMTVWVLRAAIKSLNILGQKRRDEISESLELKTEEIENWQKIISKMYVPFHDQVIISQFEGYDKLKEFDWEGYRSKYGDIHRLDRLLEAEGDSPNNYKVSKQADALMLFYLFSAEELVELFREMGYQFDPSCIPANIDYYLNRTSNGSTLSNIVHSWVLARSDRARSWCLFKEALESDVSDIQGGTTGEGIHLGAMAGTVDIIQRCYMGIEFRNNVIYFNPDIPEELKSVSMTIRYRENWLCVKCNRDTLSIESEKCAVPMIMVGFRENVHLLEPGGALVFDITKGLLKIEV